jgi:hypothetical protein
VLLPLAQTSILWYFQFHQCSLSKNFQTIKPPIFGTPNFCNLTSTSAYSNFESPPLMAGYFLIPLWRGYFQSPPVCAWATYLTQTRMQNCFQSTAVSLDVFILGSWPDSGRNPGREGLIAGRTFRVGLDKLLQVAFCGTQLTKKGLRRCEGESNSYSVASIHLSVH